jgi:hypothetical protein
MTRAEKKRRRAQLREDREALEDLAIEKAVELEKLEHDREELQETLDEKRRRRDELQARDPELEAVIDKVEREIAQINERIAAILPKLAANHKAIEDAREREDAIEANISKLTRRIRRLTREIRATVRPKIVDLHMPFKPGTGCTPHSIVGSIGHYTAGPLFRTDEEAVRGWWTVRAQHIGQGWSNIGYHIGLGPEGGIYLLRPKGCVGAHTLGKNTGYVGLSVHGTTGHTWTRAQRRALNYIVKKYDLKPVSVHNDWNATACPGSFEAGYKAAN